MWFFVFVSIQCAALPATVLFYTILCNFGGPGAHFGGPGAYFEDLWDWCDFGSVSAAKN